MKYNGQVKVILIAVDDGSKDNFPLSLAELQALAQACDLQVLTTFVQNLKQINRTTYFNSGKITELTELSTELEAEAVVANDELSGLQLRNLTKSLQLNVIDRTGLILEIFSRRATSKEAQLQVSIARKNYDLTHLVGQHRAIYSQQGGSGFRGGGETQLELDRRALRKQISGLKTELKEIVRQRQTQRKNRKHNDIKQVALVGYTNSGKSSLLNVLVGSNPKKVLVQDMLFATLQTASRIVYDYPFSYIITDTVGFIEQLPTYLVEAFKSTLEEIKEADLLLLVVDLSNPNFKRQLSVTKKILGELACQDIPVLHVYNKADLIGEQEQYALESPYIVISCLEQKNIDSLRQQIKQELFQLHRVKLLLPYENYGLLAKLEAEEEVKEIFEVAEGVEVIADIKKDGMANYQNYFK